MNKYVQPRPYADPDAAARKIIELANSLERYMDNRLLIEKINGPFLYELKGRPRPRHRQRLARDAQEWNLCEVHPGRRGAVR
jgi:hypothetical protein